jgi:predicted NBD/HSP70 family sugar kinase
MNVLVIDVGGTHVKARSSSRTDAVKFASGPYLTPAEMMRRLGEQIDAWEFDAVSIGIPAPVRHEQILLEPVNLGGGWIDFDFSKAFSRPVRIVNDAVMQALGSYTGGRMLFLGLGTGLGTALIDDGHAIGLELAHLPYRRSTYEDYVGEAALKRMGRKRWEKRVHAIATMLFDAMVCETLVLGGGNARLLKTLPAHARLGTNANAFPGGIALWADIVHGQR